MLSSDSPAALSVPGDGVAVGDGEAVGDVVGVGDVDAAGVGDALVDVVVDVEALVVLVVPPPPPPPQPLMMAAMKTNESIREMSLAMSTSSNHACCAWRLDFVQCT